MKLGLVGCGYWGQKCIETLKKIKNCRLAWVADTDQAKLEPYKKQGYRVTQEYRDILNDKDTAGVLVLTPATSHYSLVRDCLRANKHVFVEKPLTTSSVEATELTLLAESKKLNLMTGHIYTFHPAIEYIKWAIVRQELAPPLHFHFQRRNFGPIRDDVNVLWDLGPHEVSIMVYLTGTEPTDISAIGMDILNRGRPDIVSANLVFGKNISASMVFSWVDPVKIRDLTVISRTEMLVFDDMAADKVKRFDVSQKNMTPDPASQQKLNITAVPIPDKEPLRMELEYFVNCLENVGGPLISGHEGLVVVKILEDMEKVMIRMER